LVIELRGDIRVHAFLGHLRAHVARERELDPAVFRCSAVHAQVDPGEGVLLAREIEAVAGLERHLRVHQRVLALQLRAERKLARHVLGDAPRAQLKVRDFEGLAGALVYVGERALFQLDAGDVELHLGGPGGARRRGPLGARGAQQVLEIKLPALGPDHARAQALDAHLINRHLPAQERQQPDGHARRIERGKIVLARAP